MSNSLACQQLLETDRSLGPDATQESKQRDSRAQYVKAISAQQTEVATSLQIEAATTHQIEAATSLQIEAATTHQIDAITTHQIDAVTSRQIEAATDHQIEAATAQQIEAVVAQKRKAAKTHLQQLAILKVLKHLPADFNLGSKSFLPYLVYSSSPFLNCRFSELPT